MSDRHEMAGSNESCGNARDPKLLRLVNEWANRLSLRRGMCCVFVALVAMSLRLVVLPLVPIPKPAIHDEFSYLLAGETFAHGRLTNPTPHLARFFETFHENLYPTYASIYPPAQGLFLALGIVLFGNAWFGVLLSIGLMCGLVCWAIQGWFHPRYGLYGGLLTLLIFGLDHYWINSYWGGALAACGGALVLGAIPRLVRKPSPSSAVAAALGTLVLANSRPYEGLVFFCAACVGFLCWHGGRKAAKLLRVQVVVPAVLI